MAMKSTEFARKKARGSDTAENLTAPTVNYQSLELTASPLPTTRSHSGLFLYAAVDVWRSRRYFHMPVPQGASCVPFQSPHAMNVGWAPRLSLRSPRKCHTTLRE